MRTPLRVSLGQHSLAGPGKAVTAAVRSNHTKASYCLGSVASE